MCTIIYDRFYFKAGYEFIDYEKGCSSNVALADIAGRNYLLGNATGAYTSYPVKGQSLSGFGEAGGSIGKFGFDGGVKYENYTVTHEKVFSYTGTASYAADQVTEVHASHGLYYAHPDILYYSGITDEISRTFKMAQARNYAAGISRMILGFRCGSDVYYSQYRNLNPLASYVSADELFKKLTQLNQFSNESSGNTYGVELSVKGSYGDYAGWISYAYSVAKRSNSVLHDFYSDYDQTHLLRAVVSRDWGRFTASMIFNLNSSTSLHSREKQFGRNRKLRNL